VTREPVKTDAVSIGIDRRGEHRHRPARQLSSAAARLAAPAAS
jgi:hypothetical protein